MTSLLFYAATQSSVSYQTPLSVADINNLPFNSQNSSSVLMGLWGR